MPQTSSMKPRIAVLPGDRNGVGPEVMARLLARPETRDRARVLGIGDRRVLAEGCRVAGLAIEPAVVPDPAEGFAAGPQPAWLDFAPVSDLGTNPGEARAGSGREMVEALRHVAGLAREGAVDGIVFAPLNKQVINMADPGFADELTFLAGELGHEGPRGELNVLDGLWTSRVTSHIPLGEVASRITEDSVYHAIRLAHDTLLRSGRAGPRLAVSGLNPHAGDGGLFGREEIDHIAPAVARAREQGVRAEGPFPADTIFVRARDGAFDAVVTMYHDQGQIAMKLLGFGRGVTVLGGLPLPVTTAGHGTAYDIAGKGVATGEAMWQAFQLCCEMASREDVPRPIE